MKRIFGLAGLAPALFSLSISAAMADPTPIIHITTDAYPNTYVISVERDGSGSVTALDYVRDNGSEVHMTVSDLESAPQVLLQDGDHDVIFLSLEPGFDANKGGHGTVRFLYNGATGNYKNFRILIDVAKDVTLRSDPNPNDPNSDKNSYTGPFNHLFMKKRTILRKTIGIDHIEPSEH